MMKYNIHRAIHSLFQICMNTRLFVRFVTAPMSLILSCVVLCTSLLSIPALSQSSSNPINLTVPLVTVGDKRFNTKLSGANSWLYEGNLTDNDAIRYGWSGKSIDLTCKSNPRSNCGYLKIYINDNSTEDNLITEYGTSPLPVAQISSKLIAGFNRIMIVYIEPNSEKSTSQVTFSFNYRTEQERPQITVLEPSQGTLFMEEKRQGGGVKFKVELTNFSLTGQEGESMSEGQLKVYLNQVVGKPLAVIKSSRDLGQGRHLAEFSSNDFDTEAVIPDSKNSQLLFVLAKSNGDNIDVSATRTVVTNYGRTLSDIGIPEIVIEEPRADRVDLRVDGDRKFIVSVKNFSLLSEITDGPNDPKEGYMQIFIDDLPVQSLWGTTEFTLNDIKYASQEDGKKTMKIQLVNKDFTRLSPEASASLDFIYKSDVSNLDQDSAFENAIQVDSTNWRVLFIGVIVLTITIGITILIFKG